MHILSFSSDSSNPVKEEIIKKVDESKSNNGFSYESIDRNTVLKVSTCFAISIALTYLYVRALPSIVNGVDRFADSFRTCPRSLGYYDSGTQCLEDIAITLRKGAKSFDKMDFQFILSLYNSSSEYMTKSRASEIRADVYRLLFTCLPGDKQYHEHYG